MKRGSLAAMFHLPLLLRFTGAFSNEILALHFIILQFLFTFFILLLISLFATNCNTEHYNFDNSDKYYKYDISLY